MPRRMLTEGQLQLSAMHLSRTYEHHHKRLSLRSFYTMDDSDSEQKSEMLRTFSNISLVGDYPLDNRGKHTMPGGLNHNALGKSFRKKVKKIAKKEKRYEEWERITYKLTDNSNSLGVSILSVSMVIWSLTATKPCVIIPGFNLISVLEDCSAFDYQSNSVKNDIRTQDNQYNNSVFIS
uniref:Transmembrane protein n=1 Tax=Heterorhabditis bacteriophora TaxID=37862 RepID=A0A1I7X687_HETBA